MGRAEAGQGHDGDSTGAAATGPISLTGAQGEPLFTRKLRLSLSLPLCLLVLLGLKFF